MVDFPDVLQARLTTPTVTPSMRRTILNEMFNIGITEDKYESLAEGFGSYFVHWYEEQCGDRRGPIAKMSHRELLDIIGLFKDPAATRESIMAKIPRRASELQCDTQIENALTLAARIWSISTIGDLQQCLSFGSKVTWSSGTLGDTLKYYYLSSPKPVESVKIPKIFNAVNLNRIAGIKICWTSNLLDHLQMTDDDRTVHIFHLVSFLKLHKTVERYYLFSSSESDIFSNNTSSKLLPEDFIEETLDTLALLLPQDNPTSSRWFQQRRKELDLDPAAGTNGHLNASSRRLDKFKYWG